MKRFKKILKWLGITLLLVIAAVIILPIVFEDEIADAVKDVVNENVNAEFNFGAYDLTMFEDFPNFTLTVEDVVLTGVDQFAGITLAEVDKTTLTIDLSSVFGDTYKIRKMGLEGPRIHVMVLEDGSANYDIALPDSIGAVETPAEDEGEATPFGLGLEEYYIHNGSVVYDDASLATYLSLRNLNHDGSGDFTLSTFLFETTTTADSIIFDFDGVRYMNEAALDLKADLDMDMDAMKFTFNENLLKVNELGIGFDGYVAMPGDDIDMDITYGAEHTDFRELLSLVPAVYAKEFASVQTSGAFAFDGWVKGVYNDNDMPGFSLNLEVDKARFQYPDLPESVENINVDATIEREGGPDLDNLKIDVPKFNMAIANNPINATLKLRHPMSDPDLACTVKSQMDLAQLGRAIPLEEGEEYAGTITADLDLAGRLSAIEEERYEDFKAEGQISFLDLLVNSPEVDYTTNISAMYLNFSPEFAELARFESTVGKSDFQANGRIDNILAWYLKDETLKGNFTLNSSLIDLRELMGDFLAEETPEAAAEPASEPVVATAEEELGVIAIPNNIDFDMVVGITKMIYPYDTETDIDMDNINGHLILRDGIATLDHIKVGMMGGTVDMDGTYNTADPSSPKADFGFGIENWDIRQTGETFNTVQKLAPILKSCTGDFSTNLRMSTNLDQNMEPVMSSLTGLGDLTSGDVGMENVKLFERLAQELKYDKLKGQHLNDVKMKYAIADGKLTVEPFDVKMGKSSATIEGWSSIDQTINYVIGMEIPRSDMGGGANALVNNLTGQMNDAGANVSIGDNIPVGIGLTGPMDEPKIKLTLLEGGMGSLQDIKDQAVEEVKEVIEEKVEEVKEDAKAKAREEADKILAAAQKQADEIKAQAAIASEKVKTEGYASADQIEKEAESKGFLAKKAADKLAKETREKADKEAKRITDEANTKADKIMADAQVKADAKLNE